MKLEIKQNGRVLLASKGGHLVPMVFKNLSGRTFSGDEYLDYLRMMHRDIGVCAGEIELYRDGVLANSALIREF